MMATNNNFYNNNHIGKRPNGTFVDTNDPSKRPKPGPIAPNGSFNNNTGFNNTIQNNTNGWVNTDAQQSPSTSNRVHMQTMNVKTMAPNQKNTLGNKMAYRSPPPNTATGGPPPQRTVNMGSNPNPFSGPPQQMNNAPPIQNNSFQNGFQQPNQHQGQQDYFGQPFQGGMNNNAVPQQSFQQNPNPVPYAQPMQNQNKPIMQQPQNGFAPGPNQMNQPMMNGNINQGFQNKPPQPMSHQMPNQQMQGSNPMQPMNHQMPAQQMQGSNPMQPMGHPQMGQPQQGMQHNVPPQQMKPPQQHIPPQQQQPIQAQQKSPIMQPNQMGMPQGQPAQNSMSNYPQPNQHVPPQVQPPQHMNQFQQQPGMQGRPNSAPSTFPPNQSNSFGAPATSFTPQPGSGSGGPMNAPPAKPLSAFPSNAPNPIPPIQSNTMPPVNKGPAVHPPPQNPPQQGFISAPVQNANRPISAPAALPPKPGPTVVPPTPSRVPPQQSFAPQPSVQPPAPIPAPHAAPVHTAPPTHVQRPPMAPVAPQPLSMQPNFDDLDDDELLSNAYDTFESSASQTNQLKPPQPPAVINNPPVTAPITPNKPFVPLNPPVNTHPLPLHNTHPAPNMHPNPIQHNVHPNPAPVQKPGPAPMNPPISAPPTSFKPTVPAPSTIGLPLAVQQPPQPVQQPVVPPKPVQPIAPSPVISSNSSNNVAIPESQGMSDTQANSFLEQQVLQLKHKVDQLQKEEQENKSAMKKIEEEKKKLADQLQQQDVNLRVLRDKNTELTTQSVQKGKQIEELQLKINQMTAQAKHREHDQNTEKLNTKITFLEQEKVELQNKVNELTKDAEKLKAENLKMKQARDSALDQLNRQQKEFAQKIASKDKENNLAVTSVPSPKLPGPSVAAPPAPVVADTVSFLQLVTKRPSTEDKSVELIKKLFDFDKSGVLGLLNFCHTTTALESHVTNAAKRPKLNSSPVVPHNNNNDNQEPKPTENFLTGLGRKLTECLSAISNEESHPSHMFPILGDFISYAMKDRKQIDVVDNSLNLLETLLVNSDECRDLFSMCNCNECQKHPATKQSNLPDRFLPIPQCPRILIRTKSGGMDNNNNLKIENPPPPSTGIHGDSLLTYLITNFKDFVLSDSIIEKLLRIFSITLTTITSNNLGNTFDTVDHQLKRFEILIQNGSIDILLRHKDNMTLPATTVSLLFYLLTSPHLFELATKGNHHQKSIPPLDRLSKLLLMKLPSHEPLPFRHQIMHLLSFLVHHHKNGAALLLQCNEDLIMRVILLLQQELDSLPPTEDPHVSQDEEQWKLIRESFNLLCDLVRYDSSGLFAGDKLTFLAVVKKLMKYSNCQPPLSDLAARAATLKSTFIESLNDMEAS